jgi:hypothetical protein
VILLLFACVRRDEGGETDPPPPAADGTVTLADANNYAYEGTLDAPSFRVAPDPAVTIDWSALRTDIQCHALDPVADIDNAVLLNFPYLGEQEVEAGLADGALAQVDMGFYVSWQPGDATRGALAQFTFFGTDPDLASAFTADSGTWMVLLTTGTAVAVGARMLAFLEPVEGEANTSVMLTDGCPVLDFQADLASLTHVPVLAGGPWALDWSALTRDGHGNDFVATRVDTLMVARFDRTVPELQASFLDLYQLAAASWTYDLHGGTAADLGALDGPSEPFPGFTGDGVWVMALLCGGCSNPAPVFLTVVEPG